MKIGIKLLLISLLVFFSLIIGGLLGYFGDFSWLTPKEKYDPVLTSVEIQGKLELDLSHEGKWSEQLATLYLSQNNPKTTKTFEQLIRQQVRTAHYQTIFRDPAIPIPTDIMHINIQHSSYDQSRKRIIVPYTMDGYMVTREDQLYNALPGLDNEKDTYTEVFIVPADPTKLFQRLGYACANQDGVPLGNVDDKNYGEYFDPKCAPGVNLCANPSGKPMDACLDVLQKENGVGSLSVHFERVDYDEVLAAKWQTDTTQVSKGIDFVVDKKKLGTYDIVYKNFEPNSCAIQEACVKGPGVRRLLRFSGATKNIGDTDLTFGSETEMEKTNQFHYNACHKHYHMDGYAQYSLGKPGKAPIAGSKQSFCVQGTDRTRNDANTPFNSEFDCQNQGINAGWEDEYFIGLDCQWVDITDLPITGESEQFQLSMEVNTEKLLCEGRPNSHNYVPAFDANGRPIVSQGKPVLKQGCSANKEYYKNNKETVTVTIPKTGSSINQTCETIDFGSKRNCGWDMNEVTTCKAGETVMLTNPKELLRVCPDGFSCSYDDAIASTDQRTVTFTCPKEGKYLILTAPYVAN